MKSTKKQKPNSDKVFKRFKNAILFYPKIGVPYKFFPKKLREWLEEGGLEEIKKEMPITYEFIQEMDREIEIPPEFGLTTKFFREVQEKMREMGYLKEDEVIYPTEIYNIFTFILNPFFSKSERPRHIVEAAIEVLKEKMKEEPEAEYLKYVYDVFKFWKKMNDKK